MSLYHEKTTHAARGQWEGILGQLNVDASFLNRKNGPCPFCGGTDRFRFLNYQGSGSWVCNQCRPTPGTGIDFVMEYTGLPFPEAAARVDEIIRNERPGPDKPRREKTPREQLSECLQLWNASAIPAPGDKLHRYLSSRGLGGIEIPENLRLHSGLRDGDGGCYPCMLARVSGPDGKGATLHRTFLRPDGHGKAEIETPRKLMPGSLPDGSCVRLGPVNAELGIAEGIETALSASALYGLPVWAGISAPNMVKWLPPEGVESVTIFGDADANFTGQSAAYTLAHRIKCDAAKIEREIDVVVKLPPALGWDWNDVLLSEQRRSA